MVPPTKFQRSRPPGFTGRVDGYNMGAQPARSHPATGDVKIPYNSCDTCTYTISALAWSGLNLPWPGLA